MLNFSEKIFETLGHRVSGEFALSRSLSQIRFKWTLGTDETRVRHFIFKRFYGFFGFFSIALPASGADLIK